MNLKDLEREYKRWSVQQAIEERVRQEDLWEWALLPSVPASLSSDLMPAQKRPPLAAVISFGRSCMP
jgi:hypothetical protein